MLLSSSYLFLHQVSKYHRKLVFFLHVHICPVEFFPHLKLLPESSHLVTGFETEQP